MLEYFLTLQNKHLAYVESRDFQAKLFQRTAGIEFEFSLYKI